METYNEKIANLENVEFIQVSHDSDEDPAEKWAAKEAFPWLTILPDDVEKSGLKAYKTTNSVPEYHLVDSEGKTIVAGSASGQAAFAKIAELSAPESQ